MVWFYCDDCGDSIKKPKIAAHSARCSASSYTCIDCSLVFDRNTVQRHTQCVSEHEKYAQGATKPGGFAAQGFVGSDSQQQPGAAAGKIEGEEFLTKSAPWKCTLCNVNCTSYENIVAHAQGAKHKRKSKAALAARNGGTANNSSKEEEQKTENGTTAAASEDDNKKRKSENNDEEPASKKKKEKKSKNSINSAADEANGKSESSSKPKWKELAVSALSKAENQSMKLKRLLSSIIKAAGVEKSDDVSDKALQKLKKSKKFSIDGKIISLTTSDD